MSKEESKELIEFYHLYHIGEYKKASSILRLLIKQGDNSAWIWTRLSSVYYEQRRYKLGLRYAEKAMSINPDSALVLWDYAAALFATKKYREAKKVYFKIQSYTNYEIGKYYTGLGIPWAKSVKNDCNFKISQICWIINKDSAALYYYKQYKKGVKKNIKSIYDKPTIALHEKRLKEMDI